MILSEVDTLWAADEFINYFDRFKSIEDYIRFTKEAAANNGIEKCKEKFQNVLDIDNNGCYIHYQKKVTDF